MRSSLSFALSTVNNKVLCTSTSLYILMFFLISCRREFLNRELMIPLMIYRLLLLFKFLLNCPSLLISVK